MKQVGNYLIHDESEVLVLQAAVSKTEASSFVAGEPINERMYWLRQQNKEKIKGLVLLGDKITEYDDFTILREFYTPSINIIKRAESEK